MQNGNPSRISQIKHNTEISMAHDLYISTENDVQYSPKMNWTNSSLKTPAQFQLHVLDKEIGINNSRRATPRIELSTNSKPLQQKVVSKPKVPEHLMTLYRPKRQQIVVQNDDPKSVQSPNGTFYRASQYDQNGNQVKSVMSNPDRNKQLIEQGLHPSSNHADRTMSNHILSLVTSQQQIPENA